MGLDMYLSAIKYVSGYDFSNSKEKTAYKRLLTAFGLTEADKLQKHTPSGELKLTVAYWRKANAIHKWFVDNVQDGRDECQNSYVEREQLEKLVTLCEEVLADHSQAQSLLPSASGFFFGSTDYDEWYYHDLKETISQINSVLKNDKFKDCSFEYHSSW
jgi:hypothetical protein